MSRSTSIKSNQLKNIRITSGKWRNTKLEFIHNINLRPTPERIRETVFNWIATDIYQASVLDCFSGTGVFALEAISRGASYACAIDKSVSSCNNIKKQVIKLSATNIDVVNADCLSYLQANTANKSYDIIFIDPPFHQEILAKTCMLLAKNNFLHQYSLVYTETEIDLLEFKVPISWKLIKSKQAKNINYQLWQVQ